MVQKVHLGITHKTLCGTFIFKSVLEWEFANWCSTLLFSLEQGVSKGQLHRETVTADGLRFFTFVNFEKNKSTKRIATATHKSFPQFSP